MSQAADIKQWLDSPTGAIRRNGDKQTNRHLLNMSEIEVRAGIPERGLAKWWQGKQSLSPTHIHNLVDVLETYGYQSINSDHNTI